MNFGKDILDSAKRLNSRLKDESVRLKAEADEAQQKSNTISKLLQYLENGWPMHYLYYAKKEKAILDKIRSERPDVISFLDETYIQAKEESDRIMRRYPSVFEEACKKVRITLDANSRHPKYGIKGGFFRVEINEGTRIAKISDFERKLEELPADVEAVAEKIRSEYKRVFGRNFHWKNFLSKIRAQYNKVIAREKAIDGASVPIMEIIKLLKKKERDFRLDEFVADLSKLAEGEPRNLNGKILDLQQTKDTRQGVLLCGSASSRGYIGFIVFRERS